MTLIRTTLLALLLATAAHAQAPAHPPVSKDKAPKDQAPAMQASDDSESLAMAALEGLMAQPPIRSLPILKKVLAGSQPTVVKRRAIFVLSQVNSPEARELL